MPGVVEEIVNVPALDGTNLVGILSTPTSDVPAQKVLFILSHSGLVHKPGSHRGQHNLAQHFASRGYPVFRFDPAGFGDSDGFVADQINQDLFGSIETGRFVSSYQGAFRYLSQRFKDHHWVVSGVCGGAISSLLGGVESDSPIAGYALISCPVILDGSHFDYSRREPTQTALKNIKLYIAKLVSPRAIWRFITFRSGYGRAWGLFMAVLLRAFDRVFRRKGTQVVAEGSTELAAQRPRVGLNPRFVTAAREAMQRSKVLFVYGSDDGFLWEFGDLFAEPYLSTAKRDEVLRAVEHANHMFQWNEWQDDAFELLENWIKSTVVR